MAVHTRAIKCSGRTVSGRIVLSLLVASAAITILGTNSSAREFSPANQKIIAAAKAEGQVNAAWGNSLGAGPGIPILQKGFNDYYGTNIKFVYTPGGNFSAQARKLAEELAAGVKAFTDFALAGTGQPDFLVRKKVLQPVDWGALLPHLSSEMVKKIVSPDGSLITILSRSTTITYNTKFISEAEAPKTLKDLLNPKWKGKIASTPYAAGFSALGDHIDWGPTRVMEYARAFSKNLGGLIRCGEYGRVASGEFWIFAIACSPGEVRKLIEKGAPVAQNIPRDVLIIDHWFMGVPKHAVHPNAAKLFVAWLLTPEGQKALYEVQREDLYYFKDGKTRQWLDKVRAETGKEFHDQSIHTLVGKKASKLQRSVAKIFRSRK